MPKRIRRVRTFARTATKTQEKHLIENAKHLHDKPEELLPDITDESGKKYIQQLHKRIEKAHKYKDDAQKLEKIANKKGIEAAVAGTLLLAISEKAPYLGVIKLPTGDITYAQRGKAEKEKLIGIQHFTDPILRLMLVKELSFKKNLYFYSWDAGYVCTGKNPKPPQDFINFISKEIDLNIHEMVVHCKHLNPQKIREGAIQKEYYLRIFWTSADWYLGICEDCAKQTKNSMFTISKYMLTPSLSDDFDISVIAEVVQHHKIETSETTAITDYFSGKITDYELIQENIRSRKKNVADVEERILILNGKSYGDNIEGFIEALNATKYEIDALTFILSQINEPVIFEDVNANKILEKYWADHGKIYLKSIIADEEMVSSFFLLEEPPSSILKFVDEYKERQAILDKYPHYTKLPSLAHFIDTLVKTYLTFGKEKAITILKQHPDTPKGRSVAYAFALEFSKAKDFKWKFTAEEIESGEFLQTYVNQILTCEPKKYAMCIQDILVACGSNEKLPE